ncbi:MAG: NUDIX domain-containing protein [Limnohabitans sp.]|nr:NUDIX domain-containing protein [Limnohabitans sp.]
MNSSNTDSDSVRVADAHVARNSNRQLEHVAVGILIQPDLSFLLTTRPEGKVYAGYWEFPGGKLESQESIEDALKRELQEEIGIVVVQSQRWKTQQMDYPHALVQLHFCKVTQWTGSLQMKEGQQYRWQQLLVDVAPILPGALPVLDWLAQERK